jgi:hypothetical protein
MYLGGGAQPPLKALWPWLQSLRMEAKQEGGDLSVLISQERYMASLMLGREAAQKLKGHPRFPRQPLVTWTSPQAPCVQSQHRVTRNC